MRRDQLVWGVVLLLLGGLMLSNAMGIRLPNGNSLTSVFWPLLLILLGAWVLLGVFMKRDPETESASVDLQGATEAKVTIKHGAGQFQLHSGAEYNELAHGTFVGGMEHKASKNGNRLEVSIRPGTDFLSFPFLGINTRLNWDVSMNPYIPTSLDLNLGANESIIDLSDMKITELKVKTGANDLRMTMPLDGRLNADFEIGAASTVLVIPDGVAARIHATLGAAELSVDTNRFPRNGSFYESPNYETSPNAVNIKISAGAASIKIK